MRDPGAYFAAYFAALTDADARAAGELIDQALANGAPPEQIIRDVLVPAQAKVGQLWFNGVWSVADEHAATSVAEQALAWLAPQQEPRAAAGLLVLACAEGEWHTLPARLAGQLAGTADLEVVVLGGSIPAAHLQRQLRALAPKALALSVTIPTSLIAAARSIAAAHAEGVPVIVGGAAWGEGQWRAEQLGADLRLEDAGELVGALETVVAAGPARGERQLPAEALLLDAPPAELLQLALERQCAANSWMRAMTQYQRERTLEDLGWLARHAAAAVACDDPTIVAQLVDWLLELLVPRGVPGAAIIDAGYFLADAVESEAPVAASFLRQEADRAHQRVGS